MAKKKRDNTLLIVGVAAVAAYLVYSSSRGILQPVALPGAGLNAVPSTGQLLPGDPGRVNTPPVYRDVTPVTNPVVRYDGSGRPVLSTA